jgi:Flp pilus assembly pilin Flp
MRHIRKDEAGIATMEFALIAPVVTVLLFGFLEFAWVQSARSALESATMKGARAIAASDCPTEREDILTQTIVKGMQHVKSTNDELPKIESKAYGAQFGEVGEPEPFVDSPVTPNGKYDFGEVFTDVNGNAKWDPDMGKSGSVGAAGQIVSYTATFRVKSLVPFIAKRFGDGGDDYPISATTVIRNEPVFRNTGCPDND